MVALGNSKFPSRLAAPDLVRFQASLLHTFNTFDMMKLKILKGLMKLSLSFVNLIWSLVQKWKLSNNQITLNWLDALNEASLRY